MSHGRVVAMRPLRRISAVVIVVCLGAIVLEAASRIVHLGKYPLLPYYFEAGAPRLPGNCNIRVSFYGAPTNQFVTDAGGARIADAPSSMTSLKTGVFVIGDSQALGYTVEFKQTFASLVAAQLTGDPANARILAAPAVTPEAFHSMLNNYEGGRIPQQKLFIAVVNLGNDLDEIYAEGLNPSPVRTSSQERFLLQHSFTYMDWVLLRSNRSTNPNEPAGVNPILYMLAPDERIVLAREVVDNLDSFLKTAAANADNRIVVIVPSDFQVNRREFLKYRKYYRSNSYFASWNDRIPVFAQMMNSVENYMADRLKNQGYTVVQFSQLKGIHDSEVFDDSSHHLNANGHRLLAAGITQALEPKNE
jgi:hypothetical protein